jgi:hypothetical protein
MRLREFLLRSLPACGLRRFEQQCLSCQLRQQGGRAGDQELASLSQHTIIRCALQRSLHLTPKVTMTTRPTRVRRPPSQFVAESSDAYNARQADRDAYDACAMRGESLQEHSQVTSMDIAPILQSAPAVARMGTPGRSPDGYDYTPDLLKALSSASNRKSASGFLGVHVEGVGQKKFFLANGSIKCLPFRTKRRCFNTKKETVEALLVEMDTARWRPTDWFDQDREFVQLFLLLLCLFCP